MIRKLLLSLIVIAAIINGDNCLDKRLIDKFFPIISYSYPQGYQKVVSELRVLVKVIISGEGSLDASQLKILKEIGVDQKVIDEIDLLTELNQVNWLMKDLKASAMRTLKKYDSKSNLFVVIVVKVEGTLIQQYSKYNVQVCKKIVFWKNCHTEERSSPRGLNSEEVNLARQAIEARITEETTKLIFTNSEENKDSNEAHFLNK